MPTEKKFGDITLVWARKPIKRKKSKKATKKRKSPTKSIAQLESMLKTAKNKVKGK